MGWVERYIENHMISLFPSGIMTSLGDGILHWILQLNGEFLLSNVFGGLSFDNKKKFMFISTCNALFVFCYVFPWVSWSTCGICNWMFKSCVHDACG